MIKYKEVYWENDGEIDIDWYVETEMNEGRYIDG